MHQELLSPQMTFAEAFEAWIQSRLVDHAGAWASARFISPRTERDLRQYARAAARFFGRLPLAEIHVGHLREFQRLRATNPPDGEGQWYCIGTQGRAAAGPFPAQADAARWNGDHGGGYRIAQTAWDNRAGANLIRKEVELVARVMRAAGAWGQHHEECFEAVQRAESDVARAMTPDEQHAWLHAAATRPEWRLVYWWSIVGLQTMAATNEMRALRLGDIFLDQGVLQVRSEGAKNKFRIRTVPLPSPEASWALSGLVERARALGASSAAHYLFPKHLTGDRYDAQQPMTVWGMRKPWDAVRAASGIERLTPYCLRHTGATRMAESGMPIHVLMSIMGHVSPRMQQHYVMVGMQAKRRWAMAAWADDMDGVRKPPQSAWQGAAMVRTAG